MSRKNKTYKYNIGDELITFFRNSKREKIRVRGKIKEVTDRKFGGTYVITGGVVVDDFVTRLTKKTQVR